SREPKEIRYVRAHCRYFVSPPRTELDWKDLLKKIASHHEAAFDLPRQVSLLKEALYRGEKKQAKKITKLLESLDPNDSFSHSLIADSMQRAGKTETAIVYYLKSNELNP